VRVAVSTLLVMLFAGVQVRHLAEVLEGQGPASPRDIHSQSGQAELRTGRDLSETEAVAQEVRGVHYEQRAAGSHRSAPDVG